MLHRLPTCRSFEIVGRDVKGDPTYGDLSDTDVVSIVLDLVSQTGLSVMGFVVKLTNQDSLRFRRFRRNGPNMDKKTVNPALFEQALLRKGGRVWKS